MRFFTARRGLACLLLVSAGCAGWRQVAVAPTALADAPAHVRVTLHDGSRLVLDNPGIAGDSLYGLRGGTAYVTPLVDVERIAVPEPAAAKNEAVLTFIGGVVIATLTWWAILMFE